MKVRNRAYASQTNALFVSRGSRAQRFTQPGHCYRTRGGPIGMHACAARATPPPRARLQHATDGPVYAQIATLCAT